MMITTRLATSEDTSFLAWVMQAAARSHLKKGVWDHAFPGADDQRLEILESFLSTDLVHFGHWSRFLIAEVDGRRAAALAAYVNEEHGGEKIEQGMAEAFTKLEWTVEQMMAIPDRFTSFKSIGYVNQNGCWIVEWVATRPEFRRLGLIHRLLNETLEMGRNKGFNKAQIGYLMGNLPAKNAYEKAGFKWAKEYCHEDFEKDYGIPGIASMILDLQ